MSSELNPKLNHQQSSDTPIINSNQIALLASFGLHLLLYKYGFPTLFIKTNSVSGRQPVATVELTAVEQARLPDFDSEFAIPEFNNTPLDGAALPLALPNYFNPDIGDLTGLPTIPVPLPPNFDNFPSYSNDISLPPIGDLSSLPVPPPLADLDSLLEPPLTAIEEFTEEVEEPEEPEPFFEEPEVPVATANPDTAIAEPEEDKPTPDEIAAVRQQELQGNISDVSNSLQKQDVGNSNEDARKNYVSWISRIQEIQPEAIAFEGVYPKDACIRRLEGTSVYGVVVNSSNKIVSSELLKGAEYPVFNQQAINDLEVYNFGNQTAETKPYQVTVDYKYNADICPSLTLPSLRKENETVTPKPETPKATPTETESEVPEIVTPPGAESELPETVTPTDTEEPKLEEPKLEEPKPVTPPESETPKPAAPDDSLRERLQNTPLPDNDSLRERLQNTPLPDNDSLRERLQNTPLPEN